MVAISIALTLIPVNTVHADDQSYDLYYSKGDSVKKVPNVKFKQVGLKPNGTVCAVTTDNKVWEQTENSGEPKQSYSTVCNRSYAIGPTLPFHTALWSSDFHGSGSPQGISLSIDDEGYLWMSNEPLSLSNTEVQYETNYGMTPIRPNVKFADGARHESKGNSDVVFLLGNDRSVADTAIVQMPTTGEPRGLNAIASAAVGMGLLSVVVGLRRRRA